MFIPYFDRQRLTDYLQLASVLRSAGIGCELYPEAKKLGQQLKYADSRGFVVALIAGADELDAGTVQVKNLQEKISTTVPYSPQNPTALLAAIEHVTALGSGTLLA